ncbi:unnamed protein product, partial [Ectocarpus sp. 12 AP-2014]
RLLSQLPHVVNAYRALWCSGHEKEIYGTYSRLSLLATTATAVLHDSVSAHRTAGCLSTPTPVARLKERESTRACILRRTIFGPHNNHRINKMFQGINVRRDLQDRRRTRLPMDKALLGVEWRFLAHASDDEPGFSTAWLQQKSLKREADCREREYRNGILAGFANEFGMTSIFPSRRLEQGVDEDDAESDGVGEEHDHVVCNKKGPRTSSWTAPSASLPHRDLPILTEDPPISTVV